MLGLIVDALSLCWAGLGGSPLPCTNAGRRLGQCEGSSSAVGRLKTSINVFQPWRARKRFTVASVRPRLTTLGDAAGRAEEAVFFTDGEAERCWPAQQSLVDIALAGVAAGHDRARSRSASGQDPGLGNLW